MDRFLKTKPVSESPLGPGPAIVNVWGNPGSGKSHGVRNYFTNFLEIGLVKNIKKKMMKA